MLAQQTGRVYSVTQHAEGITVNKQGKGRFWPKGPVCGLSTSGSQSRDSFLEQVKNGQKKKEAKEKGTWVQPKRQPAPLPPKDTCEDHRKEPELWEPIPYEFKAECPKQK